MKQYKLIQVALLAILLFGWAGCSQNEEEVPGNVRNGIVLNVTDTGIISNEPSTRTEDTGFVTTFTQGDQIGLFAVKDGAILDEINNMPFPFNGSSWSGKPILYDDRLAGVTFYAYYPYREPAFGTGTILNLSVASNQSAYRDYTRSDFMMAKTQGVKRTTGKVRLDF